MINSPLVSVVIPVYNGSDYLAEAIDSALNQTYQHIEVLVVNDGSTDEGRSRDIALSYGDRIRYFEKENGGVSTALNMGIKEMRGEYFSWLSHDDVYFPGKIERQIGFLRKNQSPTAITYTDFSSINGSSELISDIHVREICPPAFKIEFILGDLLHGCSLLIPKVCFDVCGMFNEELRATQDFVLWFRFAEANFMFYHIPEILVKWRLHDQQVSVKRKALCDEECNSMYLEFLKKITRTELKENYSGASTKYYLDYSNKMLNYGYLKPARKAFFLIPINLGVFKPGNSIKIFRTARRLLNNTLNKQRNG